MEVSDMYCFIVNPKSSSSKGQQKWDIIEAELKKHQTVYKVFFTTHAGHASLLAADICTTYQQVTLIAVGGDGTANEVLNGIPRLEEVTFGYIPTGSSNDLARATGIPSNPISALNLILSPKQFLTMNICVTTAKGKSKRFFVSTGIGYDAAICHEALHSKLKNTLNKFGLGKLTYLGIALKRLLLLKPFPVELTLDDEKVLYYPQTFFVTTMNHKYEGGGFMFCPAADCQDDLVDICVIEAMSKRKVLGLLPSAFKGNHVKHHCVHTYRCKKVQIKTLHPQPVHTDGESYDFQDIMSVTLTDECLKFICG